MQVIAGFATLALIAMAIAWHHYGTPGIKKRIDHRLIASAAGDEARAAAIAEAMRKTVRLEEAA